MARIWKLMRSSDTDGDETGREIRERRRIRSLEGLGLFDKVVGRFHKPTKEENAS